MGRSIKKGPFVQAALLKHVEAMNASGKKQVIKTWSRASTIFPEFVGHTFAVHDGRKHVQNESVIGRFLRCESSGLTETVIIIELVSCTVFWARWSSRKWK